MTINETINQISDLALKEAHNLTAQPSIIISLISSLVIFLIIGLIGVDGLKSRFRFFIIWLLAGILILIVNIVLMKSPNLVQDIANWFNGLF